MQDPQLHDAFFDALRELDNFATSYSGLYPTVPLEREDPHIRRLLESIAFFSARTHLTARRHLIRSRQRLFSQYFSYLLNPLPSICMLQGVPTGRLAEKAVLPKDSVVTLETEDGTEGLYRTMHDLTVRPIALEKLRLVLRGGEGFRLLAHFRARFPQGEHPETLRFHVNHLNDYFASLKLFRELKEHTQTVSIFYDEVPEADSRGMPCSVRFGPSRDPASPEQGAFGHPLSRVQSFFHFPERELQVHLELAQNRKIWTRFVLAFDLDRKWPKKMVLNPDTFQLHTVPAINLHRQLASPMLADGTQERYPVRPADPAQLFMLHSVAGVYRIAPEGLVPLRPGVLSGEAGTYELETLQVGDKLQSALMLNLPQAFDEPVKLSVDAHWYQPWFTKRLSGLLEVSLLDRHVPGVKWETLGEVRPHLESQVAGDPDMLLQLLAIRTKPFLALEELQQIMHALGTVRRGYFRYIPDLLEKLERTTRPGRKGRGQGIVHVYHLQLKEFEESYLPVVERFCEQVFRILDAWAFDAGVELEVTAPGLPSPLSFSGWETP